MQVSRLTRVSTLVGQRWTASGIAETASRTIGDLQCGAL